MGQVYGEEYSGIYDLAFKIFSLQGCGGVGEDLLKIVLVRQGNVTHHPPLHLAVSVTIEEICLQSLAMALLLAR